MICNEVEYAFKNHLGQSRKVVEEKLKRKVVLIYDLE
jgi:hypothetical protein